MNHDDSSPTLGRELSANKTSLYVRALLAVAAVAVGVMTDSVTILLESSDLFIGLVAGIFYQRVIANLHRAPDESYHFGYAKFEPLVVTIEGVLILSSCAICAKFAIQDILHADEVKTYAPILWFTAGSGVAAAALGMYLRHMARSLRSDLLRAVAFGWFIDAIMSAGIFGGFAVSWVLSDMGYHDIAKYSDPVMALVLAAILLAPPITLLRDSVRELLDANPGESVEKPVRALVQEFCKKYDLPAVRRIRCRKAGRRVFVDLSFASDQFRTVAQAHLIRQEFHKRAQEALGSSDVIICFETADTPDSGA